MRIVLSAASVCSTAVALTIILTGCGTTAPKTPPEPIMPGTEVIGPEILKVPTTGKGGKSTRSLPKETTTYTVAKGDTLAGIAKRFKVKESDIIAINGIINKNKIRSGQKIELPGKVNVNTPRPVRKTVKKPVSPKADVAEGVAAVNVAGGTVYVVKSGDSLSKVASQHGVKIAALRAANSMTSDKINVGQKLVIPAGENKSVAPAVPAVSPAPAAAAPAMAPSVPGASAAPVIPAVVPAASAAPAPAVSAPKSAAAPAPVAPVVKAPAAPVQPAPAVAPAAAAASAPQFRPHKVEADEDLYSIAMMWGVSVDEIKKANNLAPDAVVKPGQTLKIPSVR